MSISIANVVRQSAKFNAVSVVSFLLQVPNQLILGMVLTPKEYGIISFAALWRLYAGLINPGIFSAAQREIPYLIGKQETGRAREVQNVSITASLLYSVIPTVAILGASLVYSEKVIRIGLILTAVTFYAECLGTHWASVNFVKQNFTVAATGKLVGVIVSPLTVILAIHWLGVYSVFVASLLCAVTTAAYYVAKGPIGYRIQWRWGDVVRLAKGGVFLSLCSVLFYGHRMADRTIVASLLPWSDLGLFTFAMGAVMAGLTFLADLGRVLEPILWEDSGRAGDVHKSFESVRRIAVYMALVTAVMTPVAQLGYHAAVATLVPKYQDSIPLFYILSALLYLAAMTTIPCIVLNSCIVNKQSRIACVYCLGVVTSVALSLLAIRLGYGTRTIAAVTVVSQGTMAAVLYLQARQYICRTRREWYQCMALLMLPFVVMALLSLVNVMLSSRIDHLFVAGIVSGIVQGIAWSCIIYIFYRNYVPRFDWWLGAVGTHGRRRRTSDCVKI